MDNARYPKKVSSRKRIKRLDLILCIGISYHVHETEQDSFRLQDKKLIVEVWYSDNFDPRKIRNFNITWARVNQN